MNLIDLLHARTPLIATFNNGAVEHVLPIEVWEMKLPSHPVVALICSLEKGVRHIQITDIRSFGPAPDDVATRIREDFERRKQRVAVTADKKLRPQVSLYSDDWIRKGLLRASPKSNS